MKRLVVFCDGTWQKLDNDYPTNVVKMAQAVRSFDKDGIPQIVYYGEGIGTDELVNKLGAGTLAAAFGWGIDEKIQDAYRFLCSNYDPDDEIYLFGFSRGAYTVRCLAGLIYCSGLLQREFIRKVPEAYRLYRDRDPKTRPMKGEKSVRFRQQHGEHVDIKVLGCWDTVGSLGVPDLIPILSIDDRINEKYKFFDTTINPKIQHAFHATAIDEIRKVFDVTPMEHHPDCSPDQVKQVWFPGGHGCVGGGTKETRGLSDAALVWMMEQVGNLELALDVTKIEDHIELNHNTPFENNFDFPVSLAGEISRVVQCNFADLHDSVKKRWNTNVLYKPKNLSHFKKDFKSWKSNQVQNLKGNDEPTALHRECTGT
jgi:uncharacterized protein (DUF2235 family)